MHFFHIISVSEDAMLAGMDDREALERSIGAAIVDVCLGRPGAEGGEKLKVIREEINAGGLIQRLEDFGDEDLALYACWEGGWCAPKI